MGNLSHKTTKMLSTRNSSILMMSFSDYLLLESEFSITKYKCRYMCVTLYQIFESTNTLFENKCVILILFSNSILAGIQRCFNVILRLILGRDVEQLIFKVETA